MVQSFSGADFSVVLVLDSISPISTTPTKPFRLAAEMQTITVSSTTSVSPVRALGNRKPKGHTKGARTFAGSMIFTVLDKDPFQELFAVDALSTAVRTDGRWHVDMLPPFDMIISAVNEGGTAGVLIIQDVVLTNTGTTFSVDDVYTETTYTYMAEHVSPFVENPIYSEFLKLTRAAKKSQKTPDSLFINEVQANNASVLSESFAGLPNNAGLLDAPAGTVSAFLNLGVTQDPVLQDILPNIKIDNG